jgi:formylglycine-generating enzyme required for sulfatase activity
MATTIASSMDSLRITQGTISDASAIPLRTIQHWWQKSFKPERKNLLRFIIGMLILGHDKDTISREFAIPLDSILEAGRLVFQRSREFKDILSGLHLNKHGIQKDEDLLLRRGFSGNELIAIGFRADHIAEQLGLSGSGPDNSSQRTEKPRNPYKSLDSFKPEDSEFFFGRKELIADELNLFDHIRDNLLTPITGASGVGKSSIVGAGILPRLKQSTSDYRVLETVRLLNRPLEALARCVQSGWVGAQHDPVLLAKRLRKQPELFLQQLKQISPNRRLVIFIDQFEELCTLSMESEQQFVLNVMFNDKVLNDAWAREFLRYIITLRYEYIGHIIKLHGGVSKLFTKCKPQHVPAMSKDQLTQAIVRPAQASGNVTIDPELVDRIVKEIGEDGTALPLLEYYLARLWDAESPVSGGRIRSSAYDAVSGFRGAISRHADSVIGELTNEDAALSDVAKIVLLETVKVDPTDPFRDAKRPASFQRLCQIAVAGEQPVNKVVDKLTGQRTRLLTRNGDRIEITHEILIREWTCLRDWIDESRALKVALDRVQAAKDAQEKLPLNLMCEAEAWINDDGRRRFLEPDLQVYIHEQVTCHIVQAVSQLLKIQTLQLKEAVIECVLPHRCKSLLESYLTRGDITAADKRRARLALFYFGDRTRVDALKADCLDAETREYAIYLTALEGQYDLAEVEKYWGKVEDGSLETETRLRAAAVIATVVPSQELWNESRVREVAELLSRSHPSVVTFWGDQFVRFSTALTPHLRTIADNQAASPFQLSNATELLVAYCQDDTKSLTALLTELPPFQFRTVIQRLKVAPSEAIKNLKALARALKTQAVAQPDKIIPRFARACIASAILGSSQLLWKSSREVADPSIRSWLIHLIPQLVKDPCEFVACIGSHQTSIQDLRFALLVMAEYPSTELNDVHRDQLTGWVAEIYRTTTDPGCHSAAELLLRRYNSFAGCTTVAHHLKDSSSIYSVRSQSTGVFAVFDNPLFEMGSPADEEDRDKDEAIHHRRIPRTFGIATKLVTNESFASFMKAHPFLAYEGNEKYSKLPDAPVIRISMFRAMQFCRWVSEQEQLPEEEMCYPPVGDIQRVITREVASLTLPANFLCRTGYRLPTEGEWEFACRAGSHTPRFFGRGHRLLAKYAWFEGNSSDQCHPVGELLPNDFGLFDVLGNAWEWCHGRVLDLPVTQVGQEVSDELRSLEVRYDDIGIIRGGALDASRPRLRSARRLGFHVAEDYDTNGFRLARTFVHSTAVITSPEATDGKGDS